VGVWLSGDFRDPADPCCLSLVLLEDLRRWVGKDYAGNILVAGWCRIQVLTNTYNVEAFFPPQKKNCYCILLVLVQYSSQRVNCWWYAIAVFFKNASALRVLSYRESMPKGTPPFCTAYIDNQVGPIVFPSWI